MHTVGSQAIWSYLSESSEITRGISNEAIRRDAGLQINSFSDLASKVAELQYRNPDLVLMFRGQHRDFRERLRGGDGSTMQPSIFRSFKTSGDYYNKFEKLRESTRRLINIVEKEDSTYAKRLQRQQVLAWALLQHYGISETPLLDVTTSIRVGASFASMSSESEGFFYVLAVPSISGSITVSAELEMQIVRLSNACPPIAMRPHLQEGYLLGEYPDFASYEKDHAYTRGETDVARRSIAKFRLNLRNFWSTEFPRISREALYPDPDPLKGWLSKSPF